MMNMSLVIDAPWWLILLCCTTGIGYALVLYYKNAGLSEIPRVVRIILFVLRSVAVSLLALFLLSPLLRNISNSTEKPILVIAHDNSRSVLLHKDSVALIKQYLPALSTVSKDLSDRFEVHHFSFGSGVNEQKDISELSFSEKQTDISQLVDELNTRFYNRNLSAVILASDGLYNRGNNPKNSMLQNNTKLYTIALGDTTPVTDISIARVDHNELAFLGNKFPMNIHLSAKKLKGKKAKLIVNKGSKEVYTSEINMVDEAQFFQIPMMLEADQTGLHRYSVSVTQFDEEQNKQNNTREVYIEVLDSRQKIMIITQAPHPDVAALKESIASNSNYEVTTHLMNDYNGKLNGFNLVITVGLNTPSLKKIMSDAAAARLPYWIFSQASTELGGKYNVKNNLDKTNDSEPSVDKTFSLFTISKELQQFLLNVAPAVRCPFGTYQSVAPVQSLLFQTIGMVETSMPLMVFSNANEQKYALFMGEGIWKWRLRDFAENGHHHNFNELINKSIQFLSLKADKNVFRITVAKRFTEEEQVEFRAELYNQSYEAVNEPDVNISIINSEGKKYPYVFSKSENAYYLNTGLLPAGEYKYEASVLYNGQTHQAKGAFVITEIQSEAAVTQADHQLLFSLANKGGGKMYYPANVSQLGKELLEQPDIKSIIHSEKKYSDLVNVKWIFALLLLLLTIEWSLRKYFGGY